MTLQEKIQKAKEYWYLTPDFLEGDKSSLENRWIRVDEDLPCNHDELVCGTEVSEGTKTTEVITLNTSYDGVWSDYMVYINGKWRWDGPEPGFWTPIPKLPKE